MTAFAAFLVVLAACGPATAPTPHTDVGITSDTILLGNTTALSGAESGYATISDAETAYFTYINNQGGIDGRKVTLKTLNDGYDSSQTVPLTRQLVEVDKVFAMFGALGTRPQIAVRDYLNTQKVPQLFVSTGATTWGLDFTLHDYSLGWQPPYQGEARIYARDVVTSHSAAKIGVLYQNDDYGHDYVKGLTDGLGPNASMIVSQQSYEVTAAGTAPQLAALKAKNVDTLFLFTTPAFTIKSLIAITALRWEPKIYLNSVSNTQVVMSTAKSQGAALKNVSSVSYLKDPADAHWANDPGMKLYKAIIAICSSCTAEDGFNIFGVAQAYSMVDVLKKAGSNLTRRNVMDIAATQLNETDNPFVLPGVVVKTSANDHFPISQMQLETWNGNSWTLQGSLIDTRGTIK